MADSAFRFLIARGVLGIAWADTDLRVLGAVGSLAAWLVPGMMLSDDVTVFTGLEDDLNSLVDDFHPSLVLANVGLPVRSDPGVEPEQADNGDPEARVKVSIEVFFDGQAAQFVIVLHRLGAQPEFEQDLARQMRGRRVAEDHLAVLQRQLSASEDKSMTLDLLAEHAPLPVALGAVDGVPQFATRLWLERFGPRMSVGEADAPQSWEISRTRLPDAASGESSELLVATDVTPARAAEEKFAVRLKSAETLANDLDGFAGLVAHDLRAPLVRASHHLSAGGDTTEASRAVADALQLVDGLLDYARTATRHAPLQPLDLGAMVDAIARDACAGTGMTYARHGRWPVDALALTPLDIALRNIVANAVRHHDQPAGHIDLSYEIERRDNGHVCHVIRVRDDGPGIRPNQCERIFTPLIRLSESKPKPIDGSGLGLAFVRRALESVGGSVVVESDAPRLRGATFIISWPYRRVQASLS
ncbi:MAG: HAMP domain-containing sensor histidine kinase [Pseudomonadota bacterium]